VSAAGGYCCVWFAGCRSQRGVLGVLGKGAVFVVEFCVLVGGHLADGHGEAMVVGFGGLGLRLLEGFDLGCEKQP
jgi:hypothetical protein